MLSCWPSPDIPHFQGVAQSICVQMKIIISTQLRLLCRLCTPRSQDVASGACVSLTASESVMRRIVRRPKWVPPGPPRCRLIPQATCRKLQGVPFSMEAPYLA